MCFDQQERLQNIADFCQISANRFINHANLHFLMKEVYYPSIERICEYNVLSLAITKSKKADKSLLVSKQKLFEVLESCKKSEGDSYDKSIILLKGIIQKHPFASGN